MEHSVERWFGAKSWEDIVVSCETCELLKTHSWVSLLRGGSSDIVRVNVLELAEELAHEVYQGFGVYQIYKLTHVLILFELCFRDFSIER